VKVPAIHVVSARVGHNTVIGDGRYVMQLDGKEWFVAAFEGQIFGRIGASARSYQVIWRRRKTVIRGSRSLRDLPCEHRLTVYQCWYTGLYAMWCGR